MFEGCLTGRAPPNCEPSLALSHMLRGSCTSECAPTSELSCMLRGSRSLTLRPHLGAIPRVPRVVYPQVAPPHRSYLACFEGRAPAISLSLWGLPACPESRVPAHCALTSELFHMLQGSRALKLRTDSGAISHFPRVAYARIAHLNFSVCRLLFARKEHDNPCVLIARCAYSEKLPPKNSPLARGTPAI